jgi:hypothetical protein
MQKGVTMAKPAFDSFTFMDGIRGWRVPRPDGSNRYLLHLCRGGPGHFYEAGGGNFETLPEGAVEISLSELVSCTKGTFKSLEKALAVDWCAELDDEWSDEIDGEWSDELDDEDETDEDETDETGPAAEEGSSHE